MGFCHLTPNQLIDDLRAVSTDLNYTNVTNMLKQLTTLRDINKNAVTKFARDDHIEQWLVKAKIGQLDELQDCPRQA